METGPRERFMWTKFVRIREVETAMTMGEKKACSFVLADRGFRSRSIAAFFCNTFIGFSLSKVQITICSVACIYQRYTCFGCGVYK